MLFKINGDAQAACASFSLDESLNLATVYESVRIKLLSCSSKIVSQMQLEHYRYPVRPKKPPEAASSLLIAQVCLQAPSVPINVSLKRFDKPALFFILS